MQQPDIIEIEDSLLFDYADPQEDNSLVDFDMDFSQLATASYTPGLAELKRLNATFIPGQVDAKSLQKKLYDNQSNMEVAARSVNNFKLGVGAGFLSGIGALDFSDHSNLVQGAETDYGNWFTDKAHKLQGSQEEIHLPNESMSNGAYWANMISQQGFTVGLMLETMAESTALAYLTGGTGAAASIGGKARLINSLRSGASFGGNLTKQALWGMQSGIRESYINALETMENMEDKYRRMKDPKTGAAKYTEEEILSLTSEAGAIAYKAEAIPLMILNGLQFATIGKLNPFKRSGVNSGVSGAVEGLVEKALPQVTSKSGRVLLGLGVNSFAESLEEGVQTATSKFGELRSEQNHGINKGKKFFDVLTEGTELRDSLVGGAVGGIFLGGLFKIGSHFSGKKGRAEQSDLYNDFLNKTTVRFHNDIQELKKATEEGNQGKVEALRYNMQKKNIYEALKYDFIQNKETAFETQLSTMEEVLDSVKKGERDKLTQYGIKDVEDLQFVNENFPQYIEDAKRIKEKFISNFRGSKDFTKAINMTHGEISFEDALQYEKEAQEDLDTKLGHDLKYQSLTDFSKRKFRMELERDSLNSEKGFLKTRKNQKLYDLLSKDIQDLPDERTTLEKEKDAFLQRGVTRDRYLKIGEEVNKLREAQGEALKFIESWRDREPLNQEREEIAPEEPSTQEDEEFEVVEQENKTGEEELDQFLKESEFVETEKKEEVLQNQKEESSPEFKQALKDKFDPLNEFTEDQVLENAFQSSKGDIELLTLPDLEVKASSEIQTKGDQTRDGRSKAAFNALDYEVNQVIDSYGRVRRQYLDLGEFQQSEFIDVGRLHTPDGVKKGTLLTLKVPENVETIPVALWTNLDDARLEKEVMSFGEWMQREGVSKFNEDGTINEKWLGKVPMIAYEDGRDSEKGAFFHHDTEWYNLQNVTDFSRDNRGIPDRARQKEVIQKGRESALSMRREVVESEGGLPIQIKSRGAGHISKIEYKSVEDLPTISEEAIIGKVDEKGNLLIGGKDIRITYPSYGLHFPESFKPGEIFEARPGTGKRSLVILKVVSPLLNEENRKRIKDEGVEDYLDLTPPTTLVAGMKKKQIKESSMLYYNYEKENDFVFKFQDKIYYGKSDGTIFKTYKKGDTSFNTFLEESDLRLSFNGSITEDVKSLIKTDVREFDVDGQRVTIVQPLIRFDVIKEEEISPDEVTISDEKIAEDILRDGLTEEDKKLPIIEDC